MLVVDFNHYCSFQNKSHLLTRFSVARGVLWVKGGGVINYVNEEGQLGGVLLRGGVPAPRAFMPPQPRTCALPPRHPAESLRRISPATSLCDPAPSANSLRRPGQRSAAHTRRAARHRLVTPRRMHLAPERRVQPVACRVKWT